MAKVQMDLLDAAQNLTFSNFSRLQDKSVGISQLYLSFFTFFIFADAYYLIEFLSLRHYRKLYLNGFSPRTFNEKNNKY